MPMKSTDKPFLLRLPISMYESLEIEGRIRERSVNFLILEAIKEYQNKNESQRTTPTNRDSVEYVE